MRLVCIVRCVRVSPCDEVLRLSTLLVEDDPLCAHPRRQPLSYGAAVDDAGTRSRAIVSATRRSSYEWGQEIESNAIQVRLPIGGPLPNEWAALT